jgi:hypothetical protein
VVLVQAEADESVAREEKFCWELENDDCEDRISDKQSVEERKCDRADQRSCDDDG